jgi:dihydroflavonol-4-reductase
VTEHRIAVVTGSTGYIAKHVVARLLGAGWHVRGTLRALARAEEVRDAVRPTLAEPARAAECLDFRETDLLAEAGWDEALRGASVLVHTASPFPLDEPADPATLIRPAVEGTRRVLEAAHRAGIRRVVLTSSIVAVIGTRLPEGRRLYDERDWTDAEDPRIGTYERSKTLAERAAWETAARLGLDLTAVNPGFVIGAPLDRHFGSSLRLVERLMRGRDPMLPDLGFPTVDVGDVAEMHVRALARDETIGERLIGAERLLTFPEMGAILKAAYPERRIATRTAPKPLLRLIALFDPALRRVLPVVGQHRDASSEKARRLLGITFRDVADSLRDSAAFLVAARLV